MNPELFRLSSRRTRLRTASQPRLSGGSLESFEREVGGVEGASTIRAGVVPSRPLSTCDSQKEVNQVCPFTCNNASAPDSHPLSCSLAK
jgi:hypothetical protein